MTSIKSIALFCIIFFIATTSTQAAITWSGATDIVHLYPTKNRLIIITQFSHPTSTCDGGSRFDLDISATDYKTQVAAIMTAFYAKKGINFAFDDAATPKCSARINRFFVL